MNRGDKVIHLNNPSEVLTVVSPPSSNGYEYMVCETFDPTDLSCIKVTGSPQFFIPITV